MGFIICLHTCWDCKFDNCPWKPHSWGDIDDFEHAKLTGQPEPGNCGCPCAKEESV